MSADPQTGVSGFLAGLLHLGYEAEDRGGNVVAFAYEVEVGPLTGSAVTLALAIPPEWPLNPPGGPNVAPRVLPINPDSASGHPYGAVHEAPNLGSDWEYWSRPVPAWSNTDRTVLAYMCHVRHLFDTLPD